METKYASTSSFKRMEDKKTALFTMFLKKKNSATNVPALLSDIYVT